MMLLFDIVLYLIFVINVFIDRFRGEITKDTFTIVMATVWVSIFMITISGEKRT